MTEAQATEMIALLTTLNEQGDKSIYLLYVVALGVGFLWGSLTWLIIVYGLKARSMLG